MSRIAAQLRPALSTVQVPAAEMGRRAAEYLLARCAGHQPHDHIELEIRSIMRKTTAALQAQQKSQWD